MPDTAGCSTMADPNPAATPQPPARFSAHLTSHARGLAVVAIASAVGIIASFGFQVVSARYLGLADFGLLAAFLVIVNVASIGSSALQNSVTVHTAAREPSGSRGRWPVEALILGFAGAAAVAIVSPWLAAGLDTNVVVVLAAAAFIPLTFVFADGLGVLQGSGRVSSAVWWSTLAQIVRIVLAVLVVAVGAGLAGMIGAVIGALVITVLGVAWSGRSLRRPARSVFNLAGGTIIVLTVCFAWLINSDVIFLRGGAASEAVGSYAAAAVLVKTGFLIPATLSLYLLPRFVRQRDNREISRVGVLVTLALSLATSAAMLALFAVLGPWLIGLLYGPGYAAGAGWLVPLTVAYLPWIAAQGLLIKLTSSASRGAALLVIAATLAQAIAFPLVIPDIGAMLTAFGLIGAVVLAGFLLVEFALPDRHRTRFE
jgi:O-antigen/teichoic acid export membrane protein